MARAPLPSMTLPTTVGSTIPPKLSPSRIMPVSLPVRAMDCPARVNPVGQMGAMQKPSPIAISHRASAGTRKDDSQGQDGQATEQGCQDHLLWREAGCGRDGDQASDGKSRPECRGQVGRPGRAGQFECDCIGVDPSAEGDFCADIEEQEQHGRDDQCIGNGATASSGPYPCHAPGLG